MIPAFCFAVAILSMFLENENVITFFLPTILTACTATEVRSRIPSRGLRIFLIA